MNEDEGHLDGLAIAHYVLGGLMVAFACIPLIYVALGLAMLAGGGSAAAAGWLVVAFGGLGVVVGQTIAISTIFSGRFLKQRRNYTFSFVLACVMCLFMPLGTILGIFTIVVLSRSSVKLIYHNHAFPGVLPMASGPPASGVGPPSEQGGGEA